jgi:hypothetical protein
VIKNRFGAYRISFGALVLINKSEQLKADIGDYAINYFTGPGKISSTTGLGQYSAYVAASGLIEFSMADPNTSVKISILKQGILSLCRFSELP